jgi:hypothetical protein
MNDDANFHLCYYKTITLSLIINYISSKGQYIHEFEV